MDWMAVSVNTFATYYYLLKWNTWEFFIFHFPMPSFNSGMINIVYPSFHRFLNSKQNSILEIVWFFSFGDAFHFTSICCCCLICCSFGFSVSTVWFIIWLHPLSYAFIIIIFIIIFNFFIPLFCLLFGLHIRTPHSAVFIKKSFVPLKPFILDPNGKILENKKMRNPLKYQQFCLNSSFSALWDSYLVCCAADSFFHSCILILVMTKFMHLLLFIILYASIHRDLKKIVVFIRFVWERRYRHRWERKKEINKNNLWKIRFLDGRHSRIDSIAQEKGEHLKQCHDSNVFQNWHHVQVTLFFN